MSDSHASALDPASGPELLKHITQAAESRLLFCPMIWRYSVMCADLWTHNQTLSVTDAVRSEGEQPLFCLLFLKVKTWDTL